MYRQHWNNSDLTIFICVNSVCTLYIRMKIFTENKGHKLLQIRTIVTQIITHEDDGDVYMMHFKAFTDKQYASKSF